MLSKELYEGKLGKKELPSIMNHSEDDICVSEVNNRNINDIEEVDGCTYGGGNLGSSESRTVEDIKVNIEEENCGELSENEEYTLDEIDWSSGVGKLKPGVRKKHTEGDHKSYFKPYWQQEAELKEIQLIQAEKIKT